MTLPGAQEALALVARHAPARAQALEVDDGSAPLARELAARGLHVTSTRPGPALAGPGTAEVVVCLFPTRFGPLIPFLQQARAALAPGGFVVVADLVWQTAPTPELLRAFAPTVPGREKIRPIEGYEMQLEHAGFDVVERLDADRAHWLPLLEKEPEKHVAVAADDRGAAKVAAWIARRDG